MVKYSNPIAEPINVNNGKKEAVVYFHGCSSTPGYFKPFVNEAVSCGYDVYAPTYRGHGTTVSDMLKYGYEEWEEDARNTIESLLPVYDKIHVCGHSLGGALTIYVAGLYANTGKIGKLLVMCPGFGLSNHDFYTMDYSKIREQSFPFVSGKVYAPEMTEFSWSYDCMYMKTVEDLIKNGEICLKQVENVASPVWYMFTRADAICDTVQQLQIAKELPNLVDLHVFEKSGHNILNDSEYQDAHLRVKMWLHASL